MTITRTLERLERFGDSDADRARRPDPAAAPDPAPAPGPRRSWRRRLLAAAAVGLVAVVVLGYLVGFSPLLAVSTVQVRGTATLSAADVQAAAGVVDGTPLVRVDTGAVARRVEALPAVASAAVAVSYPSTVVVTVVERTPVVRLDNPVRLVDAGGLVYRQLPIGADVPAGLPVAGSADPALLPVAAAVAAALPAATRALVARIGVVVDRGGVMPTATLTLTDGRTVDWGDTSRSGEKAQLLTALLAAGTGGAGGAPTVTGSTVDLSAAGEVVTR